MDLPGIYDVTSFEWVTIREVADIIAGLTGAKVVPGKKIGSTPFTPMQGKIPGWNPVVSLDQGLAKMVTRLRELRARQRL